MRIHLNSEQFDFLRKCLSIEKPELFSFFKNNDNLVFDIDEDSAIEIRDWAGEKLQKEGFNINYELNHTGIILEQIEDKFYS